MAAKDATQTRTKMSMYCLSECVILSVQIWEIFSETPRDSKHEMFFIIQSRYRYIYVYVLKTEVKKKYDIFIFIGISRNWNRNRITRQCFLKPNLQTRLHERNTQDNWK